MRTINTDRKKLIEILVKNRDNHRALFLKAQDGFRARAIEEMDKMLAAARQGDKVRLFVGLDAPEDHTADYNRAINFLEMGTDDVVELDETSHNLYVLDNWNWSASARFKNTAYASGGKVNVDQ